MSSTALLPAIGAALLVSFAQAASTQKTQPYAGQETREIKALSPDDVEGYLAGKGMGFAKAAELNGYPGPSHVLAMAAELGLSAEQRRRTEALFKTMETKAKESGRRLVEEERRLDQLFASHSITAASLAESLKRIGELQARVRQAHLEAHLAQMDILTGEQVTSYMRLRGYGDGSKGHDHSGHH